MKQPTPLTIESVSPTKKVSRLRAVVAGVLLLALIGGLAWWLYPRPIAPVVTEPGSVAQPCAGGTAANVAPDGYAFYENTELGFKFAYPSAWGEVTVATTPMGGVSGSYLMGSFAANPNVSFGGNATNYVVAARGGMLTDNPGYVTATNKHYIPQFWKLDTAGVAEDAYDLYPITGEATEKDACNTKALVTDAPHDDFFGYAYRLVRLNLQPANTYFGVNFVLKNPTDATKIELDNVIKTFQLL